MLNYKTSSAWIFACLLFLVALLIVWPNAWLAMLSMALLPFFVGAQVIAVLKSTDSSPAPSPEDQWYEHQ